MKGFKQLGTILKQIFIERKRHPVVLSLEVLWPIVLFLIVALVRQQSPVTDHTKPCEYAPRSLPSAGVVPFVQSYVCNLDNVCTSGSSEKARAMGQSLSQVEKLITVDTGGFLTADISDELNNTVEIITVVTARAEKDEDIQNALKLDFTISSFFVNLDKVRGVLDKHLGSTISSALLDSTIRVDRVLGLFSSAQGHSVEDIACDPDLLSKYLLLAPGADARTVSSAVCRIQGTVVGDLTNELIRQLNTTFLTNALFDSSRVLLPPSLLDSLNDVENMMTLFLNMTELQDLYRAIPQLRPILMGVLRAVNFARAVANGTDPGIAVLAGVLNTIDGIVDSLPLTGPAGEVLAEVKRATSFVARFLSWLTGNLQKTPSFELTLNKVFSDKVTILDLFNTTVQAESVLLNALEISTINSEKISKILPLLLAPRSVGQTCQIVSALLDAFTLSNVSSADTAEIMAAADRYKGIICSMDNSSIVDNLKQQLNVSALEALFNEYNSSRGIETDIDWVELLTEGKRLFVTIQSMQGYFQQFTNIAGGLGKIDFQEVWSIFARGLSQNVEVETLIGTILTQIHSAFVGHPWWNGAQSWLGFADITTDLVTSVVAFVTDNTNTTYHLMTSDEQFRTSFESILKLGPTRARDFITMLANRKLLQLILDEPTNSGKILCQNISTYLFLTPDQLVLAQKLCDDGFFQKFGPSVEHLQTLPRYVEMLTMFSRDPAGLLQLDPLPTYTTYMAKMVRIRKMIGSLFVYDWSKVTFDSVNFTEPGWPESFAVMSSIETYSSAYLLVNSIGPLLERSDQIWQMVHPVFRIAKAVVLNQMETNRFMSDIFDALFNKTHPVGQAVDQLYEYGPDIITAFAYSIRNKTLDFTKLSPALLCDASAMRQIVVPSLPLDVPLENIVTSFCAINFTALYTRAVASQQAISYQIGFILQDNSTELGRPFDWGNVVEESAVLFTDMSANQQVAGFFMGKTFEEFGFAFSNLWQALSTLSGLPSIPFDPVALVPMVEYLDTMLYNNTYWRATKLVLKAVQLRVAETGRVIAAGGHLKLADFLPDSETYRRMMETQMQLSPDLLNALYSAIIRPEPVIKNLLTTQLTNKTFCVNLHLTDFLVFENETKAQILETALCQINQQQLMQEILANDNTTRAIFATLSPLFNFTETGYLPPTNLDWRALLTHISTIPAHMSLIANLTQAAYTPEVQGLEEAIGKFGNLSAVLQNPGFFLRPVEVMDEITAILRDGKLNMIGQALLPVWKPMAQSWVVQERILRVLLNEITTLNKSNSLSLQSLNLPQELKRLVAGLEKSPQMTEVLLKTVSTLATDPTKTMILRGAPAVFTEMCANLTAFSEFFEIPSYSAATQGGMQEAMCSLALNASVLVDQVVEWLGGAEFLKLIQKVGNPNSTLEGVNSVLTQVFVEQTEFQNIFTSMIGRRVPFVPPTWANRSVWEDMGQNWLAANQIDGMQGPMTAAGIVQAVLNGIFASIPGSPDTYKALNVINTALDVIIAKLNEFPDTNSLTLSNLLQDSPEVQKAVALLKVSPQLVDIMLTSSQTPAFQSLFNGTNTAEVFASVCASPETYLSTPAGVSTNVTNVVGQVCQVNWTEVADELEEELKLMKLQSQANNTDALNATYIVEKVGTVISTIEALIARNLTFVYDDSWTNSSLWINIFQRLQTSGSFGSMDQYQTMFQQLMMMLPLDQLEQSPELKKMFIVLDALTYAARTQLSRLPGQNLTLSYLLEGSPRLSELVHKTIALSPDLYEFYFSAQIKNPGELQILYMSGANWTQRLCDPSDMSLFSYFDVSPAVNKTEVKRYLCETNFTLVAGEVLRATGVDVILSRLDELERSGGNMTVDIRAFFESNAALSKAISDLIRNPPNFTPPPFNGSQFTVIQERVLKSINWADPVTYARLSASILRAVRETPMWNQFKPYLLMNQAITGYIKEITDLLRPAGPARRIDFSKLFGWSDKLQQIIYTYLGLTPSIIASQTSPFVKFDQMMPFYQLVSNPPADLPQRFCNESFWREYFLFHPDANVTALSIAACGVNNFTADLIQSFTSQNLYKSILQAMNGTGTVDLERFVTDQEEITQNIQLMINATELYFENINLVKVFTVGFSNSSQMTLNLVARNLPEASIQQLGSVLDQLMPLLESTDWWDEVRPYVIIINKVAQFLEGKINELPTVNITLDSVLRKSPSTAAFLESAFEFTPDVIAALQFSQFQISPLMYTASQSSPNPFCAIDLTPIEHLINATAAKEILCRTNYTVLLEQLAQDMGISTLIGSISQTIANNGTTETFSWTDTLNALNRLAFNITSRHMLVPLPPVEDFFQLDGNMTEWVARLSTGLSINNNPSVYTPERLVQLIGSQLQMLTPILKNSSAGYTALAIIKSFNYMLEFTNNRLRNEYMKDNYVTLSDLLRNATMMQALFKASFQAAPDAIEALLLSPVNLFTLIEVLSGPSPSVCNISLDAFALNKTEHIQDLLTQVCNGDGDTLAVELMSQIDYQKLMDQVQLYDDQYEAGTLDFDWTDLVRNFADLTDIITYFTKANITVEPMLVDMFNIQPFLPVLQRFQKEGLAIWGTQLGAFTSSESFRRLIAPTMSMMSNTTQSDEFSKIMKVLEIVLDVINGKLVSLQGKEITVQTLFDNIPTLRDQLLTSLNVTDPQVVRLLMTAYFRADTLLTIFKDPNAFTTFCSRPIDSWMIFPNGSLPAAKEMVKELVCVNNTALMIELGRELRIEDIARVISTNETVSVDLTAVFEKAGVTSQLLQEFIAGIVSGNSTQSLEMMFKNSAFSQVFENMGQVNPFILLDAMAEYLPVLQNLTASTDERDIIESSSTLFGISTLIQSINTQLQVIADSGLTLSQFFTSETAVAELMRVSIMSTLDISHQSMISSYDRPITALLNYTIVQELVCNSTELAAVLRTPWYVNMSTIFCGDENWLQRFVASNYPPSELQNFYFDVHRWASEVHRQYLPYIFESTKSDVPKELHNLADLLERVGTLPMSFFGNIGNMSYWRPLMAGYAEGLRSGFPALMFNTLRDIEPFMRDQPAWNQIMNGIGIFNNVGSLLNQKLGALVQSGQKFDFSALLPDPAKFENLMSSAMSPESAAQWLASISVNPEYSLQLFTMNPLFVGCNAEFFGMVFSFPPGVDSGRIQRELCIAAQNNSLLVEQAFNMLDIKLLYQLLNAEVDPILFAMNQFDQLLDNFAMVVKLAQVTGAADWTTPEVSQILNGLSSAVDAIRQRAPAKAGPLCDALTSYVENTTTYQAVARSLAQQAVFENLVIKVVDVVPELMEKTVCNLPSLNLSTVVQNVKDSGLLQSIAQVVGVFQGQQPPPIQCSDKIEGMAKMYEIFSTMNQTVIPKFMRIKECIAMTANMNISLFNDVADVLTAIYDMNTFLADIGLAGLDGFKPVLESLLQEVIETAQGVVPLEEVFNNGTDFASLLQGVNLGGFSLSDLINSRVTAQALLGAIDKTQSAVCSSDVLQNAFAPSATVGINLTEVFCQRLSAQQFSALIKNINITGILQVKAKSLLSVLDDVGKLTEGVIDLTAALLNLPDLTGSFDLDELKKLLPILRSFASGEPSAIVNGVKAILQSLKSLVGNTVSDTTLGSLLGVAEKVLDGVLGLDSLKGFFDRVVPFKSLLKNPAGFEQYLTTAANFTPEAVESLMDSHLTISTLESILNKTDIRREICDAKRLETILTLGKGTTVTIADVSKALCGLDVGTIDQMAEELQQYTNIGSLVEEATVQRVERLFEPGKLESLRASLVTLAPLQATFARSQALFADLSTTSGLNVSDISHIYDSSTKTFTASSQQLTNVNNILCGRDESLTSDTFDLPVNFVPPTSSGNTPKQRAELVEQNERAPVCGSLYKWLVSSPGGSLAWPYVKSMIQGKVLYSPDNNRSRSIIQSANGFFEDMGTIFEAATSMKKIKATLSRSDLANSQELTSNPLLGTAFAKALKVGPEFVENLSKLLDIKSMGPLFDIAALVSDLKPCFDVDRYIAFDGEGEAIDAARKLFEKRQFMALVTFDLPDDEEMSGRAKRDTADVTADLPKDVKYTIRMDIDNVPTTEHIQDDFYSVKPKDNFFMDMRYMRGFVQLQEMIDRSILKLKGVVPDGEELPAFETQQMPARCYKDDKFLGLTYQYIVPVAIIFGWVFTVANSIKSLTVYRESGVEETMKIMGLKIGVVWWGWFINTLLNMLFTSICATLFVHFGSILSLSNVGILFLFFFTFSLSLTMMCYMISSFFTTASVASAVGVMFYLLANLPFSIYTGFRTRMTFSLKFVACLLSPSAFGIGATSIAIWEQLGVGAQWSNLQESPQSSEDLTLHSIFLAMLLDSVIYFVIGWYFGNVLTKESGKRRSPLFFLSSSYWTCCKSKEPRQKFIGDDLSHLPVGVTLENVTKKYGDKTAVSKMSLKFYEGQVTAVLGRNGAGKTTTMNVITGITQPSSGMCYVNGRAHTSADFRDHIGFCPQFDVLFGYMTVLEHLELYSELKAGDHQTRADRSDEIHSIMHTLGLTKFRNMLADNLSGGMRRRLSVAIAFVGRSGVIVLDEPTSAIDPNGRRAIWELILKNRPDRTIILCTHQLEEAEAVADRVVVMEKGEVKKTGAPLELKQMYKSGYRLSLERVETPYPSHHSEPSPISITDFITGACPGAEVTESRGLELIYSLPRAQVACFKNLLDKLEENSQALGISSYGLTDSSFEDVFMKATGVAMEKDIKQSQSSNRSPSMYYGECHSVSPSKQTVVLWHKKILHLMRDWTTYLTLILLPCAFVAIAMGVSKLVPDRTNPDPLDLSRSLYTKEVYPLMFDDSYTFVHGNGVNLYNEDVISSLAANWTTAHHSTPGQIPAFQCGLKDNLELPQRLTRNFMARHLVELDNADDVNSYLLNTEEEYKTNRFGGWSFQEKLMSVWYNNRGFHALPSFLNGLTNAILQTHSADHSISVTNHPLNLSKEVLSVETLVDKTSDMGISLCILCAFSFIPAGFVMYLVREYLRGEKTLQHVSGVSHLTYWLSHYSMDLLLSLIPIGLTAGIMAATQVSAFNANLNLPASILLLFLYMWATLPLMYTMIRLFKTVTAAFFIMFTTNFLLGMLLVITTFLLRFFQFYGAVAHTEAIISKVFLIFPQYSLAQGLVSLSQNQLLAEIYGVLDQDYYKNPFSADMLAWNYAVLAIEGVVFFLLAWSIDPLSYCFTTSGSGVEDDQLDEDVQIEQERALRSRTSENVAVIKRLSKQYYSACDVKVISAVNNVSFVVPTGECFGLLGVNGAGKTTIFKMLTGQISQSSGSATINNKLASTSEGRNIGYCPQNDAADHLLTPREMLTFFARLKGVDEDDIITIVQNLAISLGMGMYLDKTIKSLSGGMKRKVSVALALIGQPDIIILDEPTAGMDPEAKRQVWDEINRVTNDNRSAIVTSHSMAECEAVCSRIGILVNGNFACLGTAQHLKSKFGSGYVVKVMSSGPPKSITSYMNTRFPGTIVKDHRMGYYEFNVPTAPGRLAAIFGALQTDGEGLRILDFSVFQTSLDQVFIRFATNQVDQYTGSDTDSMLSYDPDSSLGHKAKPGCTSESVTDVEKGAEYLMRDYRGIGRGGDTDYEDSTFANEYTKM